MRSEVTMVRPEIALAVSVSKAIRRLAFIASEREAIFSLQEMSGAAIDQAMELPVVLGENRLRIIPALPRNLLQPELCAFLDLHTEKQYDTPSSPYFLLDVETGMETCGKDPEEAAWLMRQHGRKPLLAEEMLSMVVGNDEQRFPQVIALGSPNRHEPTTFMSIPHTPDNVQMGQYKVLSADPHWGFPSCARRL